MFKKIRVNLREVIKVQGNSSENLHSVDFQLINLLQEDCRLSFNKIARKLGISVGTAFNHVKKLEKKGIVKGYTVLVDSAKLGYTLTVLILIQAEGGQLSAIEQEIAKTADALAVYDITGDYDIAVIARFKDRASLNAYVKNLLAHPHIKRTVTNVALNVVKEDMRVKL
ncbi:MAG: Lrp/AsnC family transcriptional regulator [Candidatus Bathyarchaeota archaeon]|nr:Lrp/AsnC family transcriptional regulator [Candidatus Bathyarchaeota archaeon]